MTKEAVRAKSKRFESVSDALAKTPEKAANLSARAELMEEIAAMVMPPW